MSWVAPQNEKNLTGDRSKGTIGLVLLTTKALSKELYDFDTMSALEAIESLSLSSGEEQLEEVVKGETLVWRDVLPTLDAAAGEMALGDLLHGTCFSLHEAMSALQMFDPQMDAGMATATQPPPSLPPPDLPLRAFVALADEMLCGEVAWYAGLPLVQTVFRLDWLHATREPCDARLRALMLSAVRSAAAVRALLRPLQHASRQRLCPIGGRIFARSRCARSCCVRTCRTRRTLLPPPSGSTSGRTWRRERRSSCRRRRKRSSSSLAAPCRSHPPIGGEAAGGGGRGVVAASLHLAGAIPP